MPRNGSGNYTLPQPSFVPGTVISSSAVNSDLSDIATALTGSVAADGQTPITGAFKFASGTAGVPSITFIADNTTGLYLPVAGKIGFTASGVQTVVFDGTAIGISDNIFQYANGAIPVPVGTLMDFAGSSAPAGWLLCFGQAVSQATYAGLFAVCSTTYNTGGEGAGNFRLPDCRGRTTIGKDNMGGSAANRITAGVSGITGTTLGAAGGDQNYQTHTHTANVTDPQHHHQTESSGTVSFIQSSAGGLGFTGGVDSLPSASTFTTGNSATGITVTNVNAGTGSSGNVPPAIVFNKIIFAGK